MQSTEFLALPVGSQVALLSTSLEQGQSELLFTFCDHYESNDQEVLAEWAVGNMPEAERLIALTMGVTDVVLFAKTMKICARIDGLEQTVCHAGGLSMLVTGVANNPTNFELVKSSFQTFGFLCSNAQIRENTIYLDGAIGISVKMLNRYISEPSICVHILTALTNFFYRCVKNKIAFSNDGGFAALLPLLRTPITEPVAEALSRVFHNLCSLKMEYRNQMMSFDLMKHLLDLATNYLTNPIIQENLLWALLNITLNSRNAKGEFNQRGGVPIIFQILQTHSENPTVIHLAVTLLNQISTRTTTRVAVAAQHAIAIVLDLLWKWDSDPKIQVMCLKTIDILCTLSSCRKRLAEKDRLSKLIKWLDEHVEVRPFIESGLEICLKLAISSGDSRRALQDAGGNSLFINVNTRYTTDQELTCTCVQCSSSLTEEADYENESSDEEVLSRDRKSVV